MYCCVLALQWVQPCIHVVDAWWCLCAVLSCLRSTCHRVFVFRVWFPLGCVLSPRSVSSSRRDLWVVHLWPMPLCTLNVCRTHTAYRTTGVRRDPRREACEAAAGSLMPVSVSVPRAETRESRPVRSRDSPFWVILLGEARRPVLYSRHVGRLASYTQTLATPVPTPTGPASPHIRYCSPAIGRDIPHGEPARTEHRRTTTSSTA